jgi:hypothetical protein
VNTGSTSALGSPRIAVIVVPCGANGGKMCTSTENQSTIKIPRKNVGVE